MADALVVINGGSSSVKFSLYALQPDGVLTVRAQGAIDSLDGAPQFHAIDQHGTALGQRTWPPHTARATMLAALIDWINAHLGTDRLVGAGHRVTHGGIDHVAPVLITPQVLEQLRALIPLAPLHQPHNLAPVTALAETHPDLPQIACFDTAFHANNSPVSRMYGLPRALAGEVRRYGFHGLSYEYIAQRLNQYEPRSHSGRAIVAHLGSGASMCAMVAGKSVASSMGFSALDGLLMGTRCGQLDPGVLLYLIAQKQMDGAALQALLYEQSGLLGVSGISADLRTLLASDAPGARDAVALFVYRIVRELGSLAAAAGGIDTLVFTGGIGEHAAVVRANVCAQAAWLGIELDAPANEQGSQRISSAASAVSVWVIPTDEDLMIAQHARTLLALAT